LDLADARSTASRYICLPEEVERWNFRIGGVNVKGRTDPFFSRVGPVLVVVLVIDPLSSPKKTKIEDDDEDDWEGAPKPHSISEFRAKLDSKSVLMPG